MNFCFAMHSNDAIIHSQRRSSGRGGRFVAIGMIVLGMEVANPARDATASCDLQVVDAVAVGV